MTFWDNGTWHRKGQGQIWGHTSCDRPHSTRFVKYTLFVTGQYFVSHRNERNNELGYAGICGQYIQLLCTAGFHSIPTGGTLQVLLDISSFLPGIFFLSWLSLKPEMQPTFGVISFEKGVRYTVLLTVNFFWAPKLIWHHFFLCIRLLVCITISSKVLLVISLP